VGRTQATPAAGVCASHEHIDRSLTDLVRTVDVGFKNVQETLTEMRVDMARREESEKSQWHEIRGVREKVEAFPAAIADALEDHVDRCPLNDITEVGIKTEKRQRPYRYDTPVNRPSVVGRAARWPSKVVVAICVGAGVVVLGAGIWIGAKVASGSTAQAGAAVRNVAGTVVP